jgi:hypothetical protein
MVFAVRKLIPTISAALVSGEVHLLRGWLCDKQGKANDTSSADLLCCTCQGLSFASPSNLTEEQ